jgi:hypothetical protein
MVREALQSNTKWVLLILAVLALVVLGLALGTVAFGNRAQAAAPPPPATGSAAPSAADGGPFACTISNIAVFSSRIHVYCASKVSGTNIQYFASSGDNAHALVTNRFLAVLNTAYTLGKPVYIYYMDNSASNPPGCNSGDCRAIDWLFIVP